MALLWVQAHILLVCLTLGSIGGCTWLSVFRKRLALQGAMIPVMSVLNTIAGLICVRLFASIESWGTPLASGQSLFGSIFLLPLIYFAGAKVFRRKLSNVFDVFTMCTITTLLFARIACICSGCCYGVFLPGCESVRWPTRECEILFYIVLLIVLYRKNRDGSHQGEIWPIYMIAYGVFRFFQEWMREEKAVVGYFHYGHIWAILSIVIGFSVYFEVKKRSSKKNSIKMRH